MLVPEGTCSDSNVRERTARESTPSKQTVSSFPLICSRSKVTIGTLTAIIDMKAMDPSVGEQREAIQHGDGQDLQGMLHPGLLQDRGHLEEVRSDHFLLEVREQTQTIHGTKHSYLQVMFMISWGIFHTQTLHGTAIYAALTPPNHHPWPFLGIYGSPKRVVSDGWSE